MIDAPNAASAAASWWTRQLGAPKFDNGGDGTASMLAVLATASGPPIGEEKFFRFATALALLIQEELDARQRCYLDVDYSPDRMLRNAAGQAGMGTDRFPWKSSMEVEPDVVLAKLGYGGRLELVWKAQDYEVPDCNTQQYDTVTNEYMPYRCGQKSWHAGQCTFTVASPLCIHCNRHQSHYWHTDDHMPRFHTYEAEPVG